MKTMLKRIFILLLIIPSALVPAQAQPPLTESQIKAAYLYKFFSYIEWPITPEEQLNKTLIIGVIESESVAVDLEQLKSELGNNNHSLTIKRFQSDEVTEKIDILFIGQSATDRTKDILISLANRPVLTVTEKNNGLSSGSIINFITIDERIRFEISLAHAKRSNLKISSRLINVAQRIEAEDDQQ